MRDEQSTISALVDVLATLGIEWALMGGLAANRYRVAPRLTQDADLLLVGLGAGEPAFLGALERGGWVVRHSNPERDLFRLRHAEHGSADLIVAGTDYQRGAVARARVEALSDGRRIKILAPEDVIVQKLIAHRHQDLADVEAVLRSGVSLDEGYLAEWVRFWELEDDLRAIRKLIAGD